MKFFSLTPPKLHFIDPALIASLSPLPNDAVIYYQNYLYFIKIIIFLFNKIIFYFSSIRFREDEEWKSLKYCVFIEKRFQ